MEDFTGIQRTIVGGIDSFKFVEAAGVDIFPADNDLEINESAIILKPGYAWQTGYADFNTLQFDEDPINTPNGVVVGSDFKGFLPDDLLSNMRSLQHSFNKKYILVFKTHQGTSRVVGTPEDPCAFSFSTTTATAGGRKGAPFSFKKKAGSLAFYLKSSTIYFYINTLGHLLQEGTNDESFSIDANGNLIVSGPQELNYSISSTGYLVKA